MPGFDDTLDRRREQLEAEYQKSWQAAQDKLDQNYQQELKKINDEALDRMQMYQLEHEAKMAELQQARERQRLADEMAECTFQPNLAGRTNQDRNSVTGPGSGF